MYISYLNQGGLQEYFSNIWNYFDLSSVIMFLAYIIFKLFIESRGDHDRGKNENMEYMHLLCLFCQGLRGLSQLRNFKTLRPLIRMIIEVLSDMPPFSLIMMSSILFFGVLQEKMGQIHDAPGEELTVME